MLPENRGDEKGKYYTQFQTLGQGDDNYSCSNQERIDDRQVLTQAKTGQNCRETLVFVVK